MIYKISVVNSRNTLYMTPFLMNVSKEADKKLADYWHKSGYEYITESLGYDQCLYIQFSECNKYYKWKFEREFGKVIEITMSIEVYETGLWKALENYELKL